MTTDPSKDRFEFQRLVFAAKDHLHSVAANPPPDCGPESLAQLAFDPYIGRRLQMATPIRLVPPPSFEHTYKVVNTFLDGLYEIGLLETVDNLTTWQVWALSLISIDYFTFMLSDSRRPSVVVT